MQTIKQFHYIDALPEEIFSAITNPITIELWSGYPAHMEAKESTEFSIFDGDICGRNISVIMNQQLVQEWYFGENPTESIVTITLKPQNNGTRVTLEHINVPDEVAEEFEEGWRKYYWGAIKKFFK
jgi:activator of HSP90 ATPase